MKILLSGICGHMGREVVRLAGTGYKNAVICGGVDARADSHESIPCSLSFYSASADVDCIVDFSHHSLTSELLRFARSNSLPTVIATTGHSATERAEILSASREIPIFFSANLSFGIALLADLAKKAAVLLPDAQIEIIDRHHSRKLDAPSGTALMLAEKIHGVRPDSYNVIGRKGQMKRSPNEIGIHSLRMGDIVGSHEVILATDNQTLTLKHEAHDRSIFAEGALTAAEFLCGRPVGLYTMNDLI